MFEEADSPEVFALYARVFGQEPHDRFTRRWEWQFQRNPAADEGALLSWVAVKDGKIVGFLAAFTARWKLPKGEALVYHDCDLIVAPEARRRGLAERLIGQYDACPGDMSCALAYAPANGRIRARLGYRPVHAVPVYARPLALGRVVEYLVRAGRLPGVLGKPGMSLLTRVAGLLGHAVVSVINTVQRPRVAVGIEIGGVDQAGAELDELWREASRDIRMTTVRDARFFQWRYLDDPFLSYRILAARDAHGKLLGYLVLYVSDREGLVVGRIIDLFCNPDRSDVVESLLAAGLEVLRERRAHVVLCLGLEPRIRKVVRRYMYLSPKQLDRPAWFLWKGEESDASVVYNKNSYHISWADSDIGLDF